MLYPILPRDNILLPGLRGAVAFSLSTQLQFGGEQRSVLVTSTLVIVLFTILFLGGSTLPLLKVHYGKFVYYFSRFSTRRISSNEATFSFVDITFAVAMSTKENVASREQFLQVENRL